MKQELKEKIIMQPFLGIISNKAGNYIGQIELLPGHNGGAGPQGSRVSSVLPRHFPDGFGLGSSQALLRLCLPPFPQDMSHCSQSFQSDHLPKTLFYSDVKSITIWN